jgi:Cof subfamily protein (haloacid dehalogenase superfamily)
MNISLLISDVDGTLVTHDKVLTPQAHAAVHALREEGILFALTSSRPPLGMNQFVDPLAIDTPIAGFNGGVFVNPVDGSVLAKHMLEPAVARGSLDVILRHGLDPWVFDGSAWMIVKGGTSLVALEQRTIRMAPTMIKNPYAVLHDVAKIVGTSEDYALVEQCESDLKTILGQSASAVRSQPYYLDVTNVQANKGTVVRFLARHLNIPVNEIASIGDMANDIQMFHASGLSIAMGNATQAVKGEADFVTESCEEEGFAKAVERFILGKGSKRR